ncbi:MAG: hypothetical protein H7Y04_11710 [Verrucomicrobia bacterium]|nr:hypothetical protein [Cytophagales bacterium]
MPENIVQDWENLLEKIEKVIGKKPADLNAVLFLIGLQELGQGLKQFTKEQKQDLMHIAVCKILSRHGYYEFEGYDEQGWSHWKLIKKLPFLDILSQEDLLKSYIIDYFENEVFP